MDILLLMIQHLMLQNIILIKNFKIITKKDIDKDNGHPIDITN